MAKIKLLKRIPFSLIALFFLVVGIGIFSLSTQRDTSNACGCVPEEVFDPNAKEGIFEGQGVSIPPFSFSDIKSQVLGTSFAERWIEVDLSEQKLRAWEGSSLFLESLVSTGLPWWPTPTGEFRIWLKTRSTKMEGGTGKYYYYLPNVPYDMFFENGSVPGYRGFSLHGTYWHNDFGKPHSHGCVNLPIPIAQKLYYWTTPELSEGKGSVRATPENPGTRIVIHD